MLARPSRSREMLCFLEKEKEVAGDSQEMSVKAWLQGRRHQVLFRGTDLWAPKPTHLLPKFSFSSDFDQFIFKMLENANFAYASRKKILKYHNFWGNVSH